MIVEFKFEIDQRVVTPFDEKGIITMCAFDEAGKSYFVKAINFTGWVKEKDMDLHECQPEK